LAARPNGAHVGARRLYLLLAMQYMISMGPVPLEMLVTVRSFLPRTPPCPTWSYFSSPDYWYSLSHTYRNFHKIHTYSTGYGGHISIGRRKLLAARRRRCPTRPHASHLSVLTLGAQHEHVLHAPRSVISVYFPWGWRGCTIIIVVPWPVRAKSAMIL
jgi:hypothetical protein